MPVVVRDDSAEIWWDEAGPKDRPAVLLVMGLAYPSDMWFRQVPALSERYRVLRLDNRGAGRTGDVPGAPYTVETMAADGLAVLDAAGVDTAHVIGISMGGLIAQEMALQAPERIRSLVLMATHPGIADAVVNDDALAMLQNRLTMTAEQAAEASIPFNYAPATPRSVIEEDWAVRMPVAASVEGYVAQATGSSQWQGTPRIKAITAPTLVLHGEGDRLVVPENGRRVHEAITGSRFVTVPDANHVLTTDQPERVNGILLDWLDEQS